MGKINDFFIRFKAEDSGRYIMWMWGYKKLFLLVPFSISIVWISRHFGFFEYDGQSLDVGVWEVFFNIFGTVYAVVAGLILVEEFQRHSHLTEKLELELNALQDIRDFLDYMDTNCKKPSDKQKQLSAKTNIRHALFIYVLSLLAYDWPLMKKEPEDLDSDTTAELKNLIFKINTLVIGKNNESDKIGLLSMMNLVAEITTLRTQRIALVQKIVPVQLKYLIHLMGGVLVLGIMLISINSLLLHLLLTFFSSSIILIIYLLFEDLHHPFDGQWRIHSTGFVQYLERMLAEEANNTLFKKVSGNGKAEFIINPSSEYNISFYKKEMKESGIRVVVTKDGWEKIILKKNSLHKLIAK